MLYHYSSLFMISNQCYSCVNESWDKADESLQKKYIEAFFPINPLKGLLYLKNFVQNTETQEYDLNALDFDSKKNTNCIVTTVILNVTMLYESNHAVQYTASGFYRLELVLVFTANYRPGMNTVIWKSAITKICFQLGYRCRDIHRLVMKHHGNDVIR